jgi:hypothetical protein
MPGSVASGTTCIYEKKIVRQVGYLQELNRDARSTKHKILFLLLPDLGGMFAVKLSGSAFGQ